MTPDSGERLRYALFDSLGDMARRIAAYALEPDSAGMQRLDECLSLGAFVRVEFGIGHAGALELNLVLVMPDGKALELASIPAPASELPFRFCRAGAARVPACSGDSVGA